MSTLAALNRPLGPDAFLAVLVLFLVALLSAPLVAYVVELWREDRRARRKPPALESFHRRHRGPGLPPPETFHDVVRTELSHGVIDEPDQLDDCA